MDWPDICNQFCEFIMKGKSSIILTAGSQNLQQGNFIDSLSQLISIFGKLVEQRSESSNGSAIFSGECNSLQEYFSRFVDSNVLFYIILFWSI